MDKTGKGTNWVAVSFRTAAILCLLLFLIIILDEIQTSEAWLGAPIRATLMPSFDTLLQLPYLALGMLSVDWVGPVIIAWVAELLVLGFTFAFELGMLHAKKYNTHLAKVYGTVCLLALGFDMVSNWQSHFAKGDFQHQLSFTIGLAAGAVILPWIAMAFFRLAQTEV